MRILIINGPNLNMLGQREPEIYGNLTMDTILESIQQEYPNTTIDYFQSNIEGELINRIQKNDFDALVINPGAYTHYALALADCLKSINCPKVEVHISNVYKREEFRQKSVTAPYVDGLLSGFGWKGYSLAIKYLVQ